MGDKLLEDAPDYLRDTSRWHHVQSRFYMDKDVSYHMVLTGAKHKIQALTLVKPVPTSADIKAAMPAKIAQWKEKGLDHLVYEKGIRKCDKTTTENFIRKPMLPYTLYVAQT
jgi:hypothetical protein